MSYWYLATPYALYPDGKQAAYQAALEQTARLLRCGVSVFSPIVHNHPVSSLLPEYEGSRSFWVEFVDLAMMEKAHGLLVCKLTGWEDSWGVRFEIDIFKSRRKPIIYLDTTGPIPPISLLP